MVEIARHRASTRTPSSSTSSERVRSAQRARLTGLFVVALAGCENRISTTEHCLGNGGTTATYRAYTFDVAAGPALDVAGNCRVILEGCTLRGVDGIRVREHGRVQMTGGSIEARGAAIDAADQAEVQLEGVRITGAFRRVDPAILRVLP